MGDQSLSQKRRLKVIQRINIEDVPHFEIPSTSIDLIKLKLKKTFLKSPLQATPSTYE